MILLVICCDDTKGGPRVPNTAVPKVETTINCDGAGYSSVTSPGLGNSQIRKVSLIYTQMLMPVMTNMLFSLTKSRCAFFHPSFLASRIYLYLLFCLCVWTHAIMVLHNVTHVNITSQIKALLINSVLTWCNTTRKNQLPVNVLSQLYA